jgi:hypothetical protein
MRLLPLAAAALALATACEPPKPKPDAGPDTSCGLDCVAQENYGLVLNRCFEYSSDRFGAGTSPALGVLVKPALFDLEGGIKALEVDYLQGGQSVQTDFFVLTGGDLVLMRRIARAQSVSYRTGTTLTGVKWLSQGTATGENFTTNTTAFLSRDNSEAATAYRVTTEVPGADEKRTPLATYEDGVKILFGESPDHGSDSRRVFVPGVGFTLIASPFNLAGGAPTPVYLQRIRDLGTPDAGDAPCSLGAP